MTTEQRLERLERLERQNRRKAKIWAVVFTVALVFLMLQAKNKELQDLEVLSLTVVDQDGETRAYLRTDADGSPHFTLYDSNDKVIWKAPKD